MISCLTPSEEDRLHQALAYAIAQQSCEERRHCPGERASVQLSIWRDIAQKWEQERALGLAYSQCSRQSQR